MELSNVTCLSAALGIWQRALTVAQWKAHGEGGEYCRVELGDCSPKTPTDPDVQISRIRFLLLWFC